MMRELDKWAEALPTRNTVREFLEWLDAQKLEVAAWLPSGTRMLPVLEDRERLLDRYFDIDAARLERERVALLPVDSGRKRA
jgi:hypothetical protein